MIEMLAKQSLIEIYELALKGNDLGCTVEAVHLDPAAKSVFIAFSAPYRISEKVHKSIDVTDGTVAFARLDLDRNRNPIALEIFKNTEAKM